LITPPPLKRGDTIGILSTARKISEEELAPAVRIFESWGFKIRYAPNLFKEDRQFAGTDAERASDLQAFMDDPSIKAIVAARGGYGTVRIIDQIDFSLFKRNPKWVAGYSDPTVLLNQLFNLGIESLHAPMPVGFASNTDTSLNSLKKALMGNPLATSFKAHPLNRSGIASGRVVGGNLSILYSLLGSSTALNTDGCILFLEDLDEYLYHIDRMVLNMKRNGYFSKINGLMVGGMTDMNDNTVPFGQTAEEIIYDAVKEYDFPICFQFPAGHQNDNRTLIFGREMTLDVGQTNRLFSKHG
jgi:muramoyltetrapeptide carboxypeptidase